MQKEQKGKQVKAERRSKRSKQERGGKFVGKLKKRKSKKRRLRKKKKNPCHSQKRSSLEFLRLLL